MDSRRHVTSPRSAHRPRDGIRGGDPAGAAQHPPGPDAPRPGDRDGCPHGRHRQRRGHDAEAPEATRDARGFGNVEAVTAGGPRAPLTLAAAPCLHCGCTRRVWLSLRGVSAGGSPRRTPQTRSLYSYPRDKACNETVWASGRLACKSEHMCPGCMTARTQMLSPRGSPARVCLAPSRHSQSSQARHLLPRPPPTAVPMPRWRPSPDS